MAGMKFYALWLCLICILVFILQVTISSFTEFFVLSELALRGEYWRFLTAIFLHGSAVHLIYNLFALALFGLILEKSIGSRNFLLVFFVSGIIANIVAVSFYPSSLGASGAIYGVLGCLTILRPGMIVWVYSLPMPMFIAAILWVAGGILGVFFPSNVGDIAHLSGIAIGFLIGILLRTFRIKRNIKRQAVVEISEPYMESWERRYMK